MKHQIPHDTPARQKAILEEIIQRVVKTAAPDRIILFGSWARGHAHPDSDVDLLVIKSGAHRRELAGLIYKALVGVGHAVDLVVATPDDVEKFKESPALVICPALREGKVVYAA